MRMTDLVPYRKPYLTSEQLCTKLAEQGLKFEDEQAKKFAANILSRCSYYRFKAYLSPFQDAETKMYNGDTFFSHGYELYQFDAELRSYLFNIIEKVEVGVRSSFDQWMTNQTNNPFWYLDSALFVNNGNQVKTVSRVRDMFIGSQELFAQHYQKKYYNEFCPFYRDLPPGWVAIELMTFGNLVNLMQSLSLESARDLKLDRFAKKKLDVENFTSLCSWMVALQQVRNHCGHHTRLFSRNLPAPNGIKRIMSNGIPLVRTRPNPNKREEDQLNRLYTSVIALQRIYSGLKFDEKLGPALAHLFDKYPIANRFRSAMGFPAEWKQEPLLFELD